MFAVKDRVVETTTTTGTGAVTLAGAVAGYRTFASATNNGDDLRYLIEAVDANGVPTGDWEAGYGFRSANTIVRSGVTASSNAGALVNFAAGTKRVHLCATSGQLGFRGALVRNSVDYGPNDFTTAAAITWNAESYDTDSIHSTSTNPSRLTIPNDIITGKFAAQVELSGLVSGELVTLAIRNNGGDSYQGVAKQTFAAPTTSPIFQLHSPALDVINGGYYELFIQVASSTAVTVANARSWFAFEAVN